MEASTNHHHCEEHYELLYRGLFDPSRGYAFPCDPHGQVDLDALSDRGRVNYLYARAMVGRDLSAPVTRVRT